ncbi:CDP-alcohol phosphatidyltransferase [Umbelopsis sp. PMI_123]|nr:CDP-alcohol phosphatidyltransferase [Umbelopsis sp. PMI_123]
MTTVTLQHRLLVSSRVASAMFRPSISVARHHTLILTRNPLPLACKNVPKAIHTRQPTIHGRASFVHNSKILSCTLRTFSSTAGNSDQRPSLQKAAEDAKGVLNKLKTNIPTHENIYTIPNILTFSRLLASPYIGYLIVNENYPLALGIFAVAGITDMLDGFIARRYNMKTFVGSIIDPLADKTLMTILTVTLAMKDLLPVPLAAIILARDGGLILSSFYYRYISLPPPKTFVRYWDFSIPSAEVRPTTISKINTALQLLLMGASLTSPVLGFPETTLLTGLQWTVGVTTIWSGASYVYSKDAVRILNKKT